MRLELLKLLLTCFLLILICVNLVSSKQKDRVKRALEKLRNKADNGNDLIQENLRKRLIRSPQDVPVSNEDDDGDGDFEKEIGKLIAEELGISKNNRTNPTDLYLPPGYNRLEIPRVPPEFAEDDEDERLEVQVFLNIRYVTEIDEVNEEITLEADVVLKWFDWAFMSNAVTKALTSGDSDSVYDSLAHEKILDPTFLWKLWKPDIFIENLVEIKQSKLLTKPATLKLSGLGQMTYTARYTIKLYCAFDFTYFPADTQTCDVLLRSFAYNSSLMKLKWHQVGVYLLDTEDDNFDVAFGKLKKFLLISKLAGKDSNETFQALQFNISARRRLSYQLLQTYIPSILYMGITWLCFMIPSRMIEARIAIAMTTLLTLTAMFGAVRESTPVVSYIKAIDTWMCASIAFVFLTLLEFTILLWTEAAKEKEGNEKKKEDTNDSLHGDNPERTKETEVSVKDGNLTFGQKLRKCVLARFTTIITFVEDYSFVLVMLIFITFCVVYWSWLLICSGYYEWNVNSTHNAITDDDYDSHSELFAFELAAFS